MKILICIIKLNKEENLLGGGVSLDFDLAGCLGRTRRQFLVESDVRRWDVLLEELLR